MVARYLWKACILTALILLAAPVQADDSSNAEDGGQAEEAGTGPPCEIVWIDIEYPYVDVHEECLPEPLYP